MFTRWRTVRPVRASSASADIVCHFPLPPSTRTPVSLLTRLILLAILFSLELIPITVRLDGQILIGKGGLLTLLGYSGVWILRSVVAFAALFVTFAVLRYREPLRKVSDQLSGVATVRVGLLAGHIGMLALFGALAIALFGHVTSGPLGNLVAAAWLACGAVAIGFAACAFIPVDYWRRVLRITGTLWIYALMTSIAACLAGMFSQTLWSSAAQWTFVLVKTILKIFVSGVFADVSTMSIGTKTFHVEIAQTCSGLEGAALILCFCTLWLCLLRREFRFPQALILIPASVATLFLLNAVRITALILIGNAGAPDLALGGFHSQAGWIGFNLVAIGMVIVARRVQWITNVPPVAALAPVAEENPAAPYLAPFLLILAASMASSAASSGFEWLYPLRFIAAGAALLIYRRRYKLQDWHFGWEAPAIGALVFALWLGGDWLTGNHPQNPLMRSADPWISTAQSIWLTLRLLSAIVTVPIAEELAFRGYLIRRIMSLDFESLSPRAFTTASLLISSLAFGALHGSRWIAGTIAGLLYAAVFVRRGRIGDAVVAHAITNGLLAASVLVTGQWNLS